MRVFELQSNLDSSNAMGKLDVLVYAVFKCLEKKTKNKLVGCWFKKFSTAVDGLDSWSRRQMVDIVSLWLGSIVTNAWVGAQNLKKPPDSRQNLRKSLQPTVMM